MEAKPGRGYVYKRQGCWYYNVIGKCGRSVLSDNTNDYDLIANSCRRDVAAVRRVEGAGHTLRPYARLIDEASNKI